MSELFIGLMSGTSLDGVDGVLADFSQLRPSVIRHASQPFSPVLRAELMALNRSGEDELHRAALAGNALARVYAEVVHDLLVGVDRDVAAIGVHGQTVRHRPQEYDGTGYTLQLNQPALLAELTGIDVVADFRSRDVAAGGQGAPLAPFFHQAWFAQAGQSLGVLNVGGISNITLLRADGTITGFDCGPGNALMDGWCRQHLGLEFDNEGAWAAGGKVLASLLTQLRADAYFSREPPKSTGRDLFNTEWLAPQLLRFASAAPQDIQATLTELTAQACVDEVLRHAPGLKTLVVCGGGALNTHLMKRLQSLLPAAQVRSSDHYGLPPLQVEATAFAWLARRTVRREKLDLQSTTGARGARVLGCIYPA